MDLIELVSSVDYSTIRLNPYRVVSIAERGELFVIEMTTGTLHTVHRKGAERLILLMSAGKIGL